MPFLMVLVKIRMCHRAAAIPIFHPLPSGSFDADFKMLRRKGTLVSVGNASGPVPPFPPLKLSEKNLKLLRPT